MKKNAIIVAAIAGAAITGAAITAATVVVIKRIKDKKALRDAEVTDYVENGIQ